MRPHCGGINYYNSMDSEKLEPNLEAQQIRHRRVFLKSLFLSRRLFRFILDAKSLMGSLKARFNGHRLIPGVFAHAPIEVKDPFSKIVRQGITVGVALLIVTSFAPNHLLETGFTADFYGDDSDYIDEETPPLPPLIINDEGFVLKPSPVTEDISRIGINESIRHTVASGDTLSSIAFLYGVNVKTLLWENNLSESAPLRVGQVLSIPSVSGVSHTVGSKETVASIAKRYSVDAQLIKDHNKLAGDTLEKGQKIFIPGGKKLQEDLPRAVRSGTRSLGRSANTFDNKVVMSSGEEPNDGKELIFPTYGKITQGFRNGHYAYDIGNPSKPDVWAADGGTVIIATGGCVPREVHIDRSCGGGYGNHVVIDHGNGLKTLYGHMETVYVSVGDRVERGQSVGKMGNTGRTYGSTGIHLHFEVMDGGVKRNPGNYY